MIPTYSVLTLYVVLAETKHLCFKLRTLKHCKVYSTTPTFCDHVTPTGPGPTTKLLCRIGDQKGISSWADDQVLLSLIWKWISPYFSIQWLSKTGLTFGCVRKLEKLVMAAPCSSAILSQGMSREWHVLKQHWKCSWLLASWDKILGRGRVQPEVSLNTVKRSCLQHLEPCPAVKHPNLANWTMNWSRKGWIEYRPCPLKSANTT